MLEFMFDRFSKAISVQTSRTLDIKTKHNVHHYFYSRFITFKKFCFSTSVSPAIIIIIIIFFGFYVCPSIRFTAVPSTAH